MKYSIIALTVLLLVLLFTSTIATAETAADVPSKLPKFCDFADLKIIQSYIPPVGTAGTNSTLSLTIENVGLASSIQVPVMITLPNGKVVNMTQQIPPMDPGQVERFLISFFIPKDAKGNNHLSVMIDPDKTMDECYLSDNHITSPFKILFV